MPCDIGEFPLEVREEIRRSICRTFIPHRGQIYKKIMTLHPFGDNFTKRRKKYTLSGAMCCVKKGRKGERCAIIGEGCPTLWGRSLQQRGRNAVCAAVGTQKMPPKRGHVFVDSLERRRSCSAYRELELRISQTRCSDFSNRMFGV